MKKSYADVVTCRARQRKETIQRLHDLELTGPDCQYSPDDSQCQQVPALEVLWLFTILALQRIVIPDYSERIIF